MKPSVFTYYDPTTIDDAVGLLGRLENARPLAGGQSLMAMINMRFVQPDHVVDLNRVAELAGIEESAQEVRIGAMTRQRDLEFSTLIGARIPLMSEALLHVGHRQTRNRGTLGGSLCHLDPAAELVAVACACDAVIEVAGPNGRRDIPFESFPLGFMMPSVQADELVVGARFPLWPRGHGAAFFEFARRHGDFAIVSAAALIALDANGRIARCALVLGGVGTVPLRMSELEDLLTGNTPSAQLVREASERCRGVDALGDALVPASYRQSLAVVMARRALATACTRAGAPIAEAGIPA
jgi:carbon-monoxide dehydrogenase medium subunit